MDPPSQRASYDAARDGGWRREGEMDAVVDGLMAFVNSCIIANLYIAAAGTAALRHLGGRPHYTSK